MRCRACKGRGVSPLEALSDSVGGTLNCRRCGARLRISRLGVSLIYLLEAAVLLGAGWGAIVWNAAWLVVLTVALLAGLRMFVWGLLARQLSDAAGVAEAGPHDAGKH